MKKKKAIIFIGNSGCGKGTQAALLEEYFKKKEDEVLHVELGDEFRDFLSMTTDTAKKSLEIAKNGALQPEFLAIHLWSKILNLHYSDDKNLILDGTPRTLREAYVLDGALKFYGLDEVEVFYLALGREAAKERMLDRGRKDDTKEKIENRLDWFDRSVAKAIDFFREDEYYNFHELDAGMSIEEIQDKILKKMKFKD